MISMQRFAEPGSPMPAWTDGIENAENRINPARMTGIWNEIALKEGIGSMPSWFMFQPPDSITREIG